eukprot:gene3605-4488_t
MDVKIYDIIKKKSYIPNLHYIYEGDDIPSNLFIVDSSTDQNKNNRSKLKCIAPILIDLNDNGEIENIIPLRDDVIISEVSLENDLNSGSAISTGHHHHDPVLLIKGSFPNECTDIDYFNNNNSKSNNNNILKNQQQGVPSSTSASTIQISRSALDLMQEFNDRNKLIKSMIDEAEKEGIYQKSSTTTIAENKQPPQQHHQLPPLPPLHQQSSRQPQLIRQQQQQQPPPPQSTTHYQQPQPLPQPQQLQQQQQQQPLYSNTEKELLPIVNNNQNINNNNLVQPIKSTKPMIPKSSIIQLESSPPLPVSPNSAFQFKPPTNNNSSFNIRSSKNNIRTSSSGSPEESPFSSPTHKFEGIPFQRSTTPNYNNSNRSIPPSPIFGAVKSPFKTSERERDYEFDSSFIRTSHSPNTSTDDLQIAPFSKLQQQHHHQYHHQQQQHQQHQNQQQISSPTFSLKNHSIDFTQHIEQILQSTLQLKIQMDNQGPPQQQQPPSQSQQPNQINSNLHFSNNYNNQHNSR